MKKFKIFVLSLLMVIGVVFSADAWTPPGGWNSFIASVMSGQYDAKFKSLTLVPGSTPSTLTDGKMWVTLAGLYVRINGVTVGPLGTGSGGGTACNNTAYDASSWDGDSTYAPCKDAVRDKLEAIVPMAYPDAGIPLSTGTAWGTSLTGAANSLLGYNNTPAGTGTLGFYTTHTHSGTDAQFHDASDGTKKVKIDSSGMASGKTATLKPFHASDDMEINLTNLKTYSIVVPSVADTDDLMFVKLPYGITVKSLDCIVTAATSATINIVECNSTGTCSSSMATSDLACDTDGATTTTFGGAAGDSADTGDWLQLKVVSTSGSPGTLTVTLTYVISGS